MTNGDPRTNSPDEAPGPGAPASPGSNSAWTALKIATWTFGIIAFAAGAFVGYRGAIQQTRGGMEGMFGLSSVVVIVGASVLLLGLSGVLLRAFQATRPAGRIAFLATKTVVAGALAGALVVPALGHRYTPPVVTMTPGTATLAMPGVPGYIPSAAGTAECRSVPDGREIEGVAVHGLGTLGGRVLGAQIQPGITSGDQSIALSAETDGSPDLSGVVWATHLLVPSTNDGLNGSVAFTEVPLQIDPKMDTPDPSWPRVLTGTLTWSCD